MKNSQKTNKAPKLNVGSIKIFFIILIFCFYLLTLTIKRGEKEEGKWIKSEQMNVV